MSFAESGYCYDLTSMIIPESVTSIGESAFSYCSGLTSIIMPESVTSIGESAFSYCSGLTSIIIPESVTSIGDAAFKMCGVLEAIYVAENNAVYKDVDGVLFSKDETVIVCFPAGKSCDTYTIPENVTSIGDSAFSGCSDLTSIIIPDSITSIGESAFSSCSGLTSIIIPDSITSIGNSTFLGCHALSSITIPEGITNIGDLAFCSCYGLTSISIPDTVESIGSSAFDSCRGLTSIVIPNSVTAIRDNTFQWCSNLVSVTIPYGITNIGKSAFMECRGLTSINIPESVTSIGASAFLGCSALSSITIPESVTSIGADPFSGTLWEEKKQAENPLVIVNSILIDGYNCEGDVAVPDNVSSIGESAFEGCSSLNSITIPDAVTFIGGGAFFECALTSITITNPTCEIYNTEYTISYTATIHGYRGSTAQAYAEKYGRNFVALDEEPEETTTTESETTTSPTTTETTTERETATTTRSPVFVEGEDNWGFRNQKSVFVNDTERYYLKEEHIQQLISIVRDSTSKKNYVEEDLMMDAIYERKYNGSCFGMSMLAIYNCYGIIQPSLLGTSASGQSAKYLQNIVMNDNLRSLINSHSLLQRITPLEKAINDYVGEAENTKLADLLTKVKQDGPPVLFCYTIPAETFSHAVVAYNREDGLYTFDNMSIEYDTKLYIYDCSAKGLSEGYCMYINSTRNSWYIPERDITEEDCVILWVEGDIDKLTQYSLFTNFVPQNDEGIDITSLETRNMSNCTVKEVRKSNAGNWYISAADEEIFSYYGFMSGKGEAPLRYVMYDSEANYRLTSDGESYADLQMRYPDSLMRVTATQTDNIVFMSNGLELNQQGDSNAYSFHMVRNDVPTETSFHTIDVSGDSANKLTFSYENGEWYLFGDCLENIEVQANHSAATSNTLTFSVPTKYDTVCLRQMDESTIAAFVDMNNDGEYETSVDEIPADEISLGDVNTDGEVDSLDAANILIVAALVGADMDSGLSDAQKIAADTNKNGTFGAEDAALVLQYAAAVGSGYTESFEDFLAA